MNPVILLQSGNYFNFLEPEKSNFDIQDIALALSKICRFGGHCREFYSVAQHSVLVSLLVPAEDRLAALLHDASEAFLGDMVSPLKNICPDYRKTEEKIQKFILEKFGIFSMPESVKIADMQAAKAEIEYLFPKGVLEHDELRNFRDVENISGLSILCLNPLEALNDFMLHFDNYKILNERLKNSIKSETEAIKNFEKSLIFCQPLAE